MSVGGGIRWYECWMKWYQVVCVLDEVVSGGRGQWEGVDIQGHCGYHWPHSSLWHLGTL